MTLEQFFDLPIDTQEKCDEWLRLYRKWYKAQAKRTKRSR
jgi:hypothetical protein